MSTKRIRRLPVAILAVLALAMTVLLAPTAGAVNGNLVDNGDFELGNTGFDTQYTYVDPANTGTWTLGPEFRYTVSTDPNLYHSAWTSFGDHTSDDGLMMIVNGTPSDTTPKALVWGQEVTLDPVPSDAFSDVESYPLYAGQDWLVGEVLVKNSADQVCVKFVINDPVALAENWGITETHVAIGNELSDIPQKNGNPIPGQFPENDEYDPAVIETGWICLDHEGDAVIAAHAVVERPEVSHIEDTSFCLTSDTETMYYDGANWVPAVAAWVHSEWVNQYGSATPFGATWIWNSYRTLQPINGEVVEFERDFTVDGTPSAASLTITADNGFEVGLNGGFVGSAEVAGDWKTSNLTESFVKTSGWQTPENYPVTVVPGPNTLSIVAANEYMGPLDGQTEGTIASNPAGVAYKLCVAAEKTVIDVPFAEETAWGGTNPFPGKNWATYIGYETQDPIVNYMFTMYAASSYPENPAELEVTINDDVVGIATLKSTPGEWVEVTYTSDLGGATTADIAIRDLRPIAQGDDFVIDDISLVQLP